MTPEAIVRDFFDAVRSGADPDRAHTLMAPSVRAHQVQSEAPTTVVRTPADYADHVREMQAAYGPFTLEVEELLAAGDKVYVRWTQRGHDVAPDDGHPATGAPIVERASCTYRVENGRIVEYWIQIDRLGIVAQLEAARAAAAASAPATATATATATAK